jgi:hypothetical protein
MNMFDVSSNWPTKLIYLLGTPWTSSTIKEKKGAKTDKELHENMTAEESKDLMDEIRELYADARNWLRESWCSTGGGVDDRSENNATDSTALRWNCVDSQEKAM